MNITGNSLKEPLLFMSTAQTPGIVFACSLAPSLAVSFSLQGPKTFLSSRWLWMVVNYKVTFFFHQKAWELTSAMLCLSILHFVAHLTHFCNVLQIWSKNTEVVFKWLETLWVWTVKIPHLRVFSKYSMYDSLE